MLAAMSLADQLRRAVKASTPPVLLAMARSLRAPFAKRIPEEGFLEYRCLGFEWHLDMTSGISRALVRNGIWERETTDLIQDLVKPGMQVLAIGANFGYYALLMARQVGPEGHVWAFEPTEKFRRQLERHVDINRLREVVTVLPFGLSDAAASVSMELMTQSASLHFAPYHPRIGRETVELRRLDQAASDLGIDKVDFIQMDIDGHEAAFLRGAQDTLARHRPMIAMEFSQACLHVAGSDVQEVAHLLESLGYVICSERTRQPYKDEFDFLLECGNFDHHANALIVPQTKPRS